MIIIPLPSCDIWTAFCTLAEDPHVVFLNGSCPGKDKTQTSYIATDPICILNAGKEGVFVDDAPVDGDALAVLGHLLEKHQKIFSDGPAPFLGGAIGAIGYELGYALDDLSQKNHHACDLPTMIFGFYDTVLVHDHRSGKSWVAGADPLKAHRLVSRLTLSLPSPPILDWTKKGEWRAEQKRACVEKKIQSIIDYIHAGDIYQANYTQKFTAHRPDGLDDVTVYRRLCSLSPAPFSAFLRWKDMALASASPERFLRLDLSGKVEAWPIKGTRPRNPNPVCDQALADQLGHSAKDLAENLMIVDLMRNDLGRVCNIGSVRVPSLNQVETFASVHHLVSKVEGDLRPGYGAIDVLRATFPGGSITGAPKIRAMQIIHELEPSPRGFYCGCLGWIGFDGAMDMSMIIRTLTLNHDTITAQAGGGIVADSRPADEYEESMVKIMPLLHTLEGKPQ